MIPKARALAEIRAIAASLFKRLFSVIRRGKKPPGQPREFETLRGDQPMARAIDSAPKDTWDSPSPIMEYRRRTRLTPSREAQRHHESPNQGPD